MYSAAGHDRLGLSDLGPGRVDPLGSAEFEDDDVMLTSAASKPKRTVSLMTWRAAVRWLENYKRHPSTLL